MPVRVLVAFASKLGSNREIGEVIARVLREAGHHSSALPTRVVRGLEGWDAVVLGSAIYAAHWRRDARRFAERFRDELAARPLWMWSSGPLDAYLAAADLPITQHGAEVTAGLGALDHRTFGGRLDPEADIDPRVLETHRVGDFRDWDAIREYAQEIAVRLSAMTLPRIASDPAAGPGDGGLDPDDGGLDPDDGDAA